LNHKHIVKFDHTFEDAHDIYIILELCTNQTMYELQKRRKTLHELEVQSYVLQIGKALQHLHSNCIVHRDLKLSNIFINHDMQIKLGDFGLACVIEDEEKRNTLCGTPNYLAPEILEGLEGHSYEVDVWALGIIIFTLLVGKPPYEGENVQSTYVRIKKNTYKFPEDCQISYLAKDLIQKILVPNPVLRFTLEDILRHPWMKGECAIPETLPDYTLFRAPSNDFIM